MVIDMFKSAVILILLLIASRFIDSPPNFSPLLAVAIYIPRITKKRFMQFFLPTGIMLLSNFFLEPINLFLLTTILLVFLIAPIIGSAIKNLFLSCLVTVFTWFIFVNGVVWLLGSSSLYDVYLGAIPFDVRLFVSTMMYLIIFNFIEELLHNLRIRKQTS